MSTIATSATTDANTSTKPYLPHRPLRRPNTRSLQVFAVSVVLEALEHAIIVFLVSFLLTFARNTMDGIIIAGCHG